MKTESLVSALLPMLAFLAIPIGLLTVAVVFKRALARRRYRSLARLGISDVDQLMGRDFERLLVPIFTRKGYKVELTQINGDFGADLVLSKGGARTVVQAKRHKGNVGVAGIQQVVASKPVYNADQALVVTNSSYTAAALRLARANGVFLWDRARLTKELLG